MSQEVELIVVRQEENNPDGKDRTTSDFSEPKRPASSILRADRILTTISERDRMNGLGTHLLI